MTYEELKNWIRHNYKDITIVCSKEVGSSEVPLYDGEATAYFYDKIDGQFTYISHTDREGQYIVCYCYENDHKNKLALLHELGHHVSHQVKESDKDSIYYNEINAWKACKNFCNDSTLGVEWCSDFAKEMFMTYVSFYGSSKYCHRLMREIGFITKEDFDSMYQTVKVSKPLFGFENWKINHKIKQPLTPSILMLRCTKI